MNVGIMGFGEVGSSLTKVIQEKHNIYIHDKKEVSHEEKLKEGQKIDILHICIPYTDDFLDEVTRLAKKTNPNLIIVNASVPLGTTRKIEELTKIDTVHIPIRGIHPRLAESIKTFTVYIGASSDRAGKKAVDYLKEFKLNIVKANNPEETELAKLLSTTYYAWNIVFCKEVKKLCDSYNLDFETVYTDFNKTYNKGYTKMNKKEVVRPVLKPVPGPIGGHCLIPNAKILKSMEKRDNIAQRLAALILEWNKEYKNEN